MSTHLPSSPFHPDHPPEPQPGPQDLPPAPPFHPFFSLLTTQPFPGSSTPAAQRIQKTHYPHIHYIFADDPSPNPLETTLQGQRRSRSESDDDDEKVDERYILIDVDASGKKITNAQSLSPQWAVTGAEVRSAPTWDGESGKGAKVLSRHEDEQGNEDPRREDAEGMMLVVDGMERPSADDEGDEARHDEDNRDVEDLLEEFGRGMDGLRGVVTAWEGWKQKEMGHEVT